MPKAEVRASVCSLSDTGMWLCMGSDIGHTQNLTQLLESDHVLQMGQDKMTLMIVLVEIILREHWLSTWPTTLGLEQMYVGIG
jgi:hypothetical protein